MICRRRRAGVVLAALWRIARDAGACCSGCAGPLVSRRGSWQMLERTQRSAPERLTDVMIAAFGVKVLLFGAYVVGDARRCWRCVRCRSSLSFTGYYVALHVVEALLSEAAARGGVSS